LVGTIGLVHYDTIVVRAQQVPKETEDTESASKNTELQDRDFVVKKVSVVVEGLIDSGWGVEGLVSIPIGRITTE